MNLLQAAKTTKEKRIKTELQEVGMSWWGTRNLASSYLTTIIHHDEHIKAAVFGRQKEIEGLFGFVEGMLVATDRRVLYIDKRPGYVSMDEVSYDKVSGTHISKAGYYASITLFTKIANYTLSFAKPANTKRFADYIEERIIDEKTIPAEQPVAVTRITDDALQFLQDHEVGVLSSTDRTGIVNGAVIYYVMHNGIPYFMTKLGSNKAANILGNQHAALTVFDADKLQTLQLQGIVETEYDEIIKKEASAFIARPRSYQDGSHKPPLLRMGGGDFVTFRILPTKFSFIDYSHR